MTTLAPTLSTRYFSSVHPFIRDLVLIILSSLVVALFAQIAIPLPFTPVPLTGQTFAVLLIGAALGFKRGTASLALYTGMGALGLPVFAAGSSGLSGPTIGYLIGFIAAASLIGWLAERGLERSLRTSILPFFLGTLVIYIFGAGWLAIFLQVSLTDAFGMGVAPFIIGDVIKLVLAAVALPAAWKLVE